MARGGKRAGAGRKAGSATKRTRAIADQATEQGITPLEVMLDNMRFAHAEAGRLLQRLIDSADGPIGDKLDEMGKLLGFRAQAQEAAKDAAPYVHPRLASIQHTGADEGPIAHAITVRFVKANPKGGE